MAVIGSTNGALFDNVTGLQPFSLVSVGGTTFTGATTSFTDDDGHALIAASNGAVQWNDVNGPSLDAGEVVNASFPYVVSDRAGRQLALTGGVVFSASPITNTPPIGQNLTLEFNT